MSWFDDIKDTLDDVGERVGVWSDIALDGVQEKLFGNDQPQGDKKQTADKVIDQTAQSVRPLTGAPINQGVDPRWLIGGGVALLALLVIAKKV